MKLKMYDFSEIKISQYKLALIHCLGFCLIFYKTKEVKNPWSFQN